MSVVIPARDAERYIREAIASALAQSYPVSECLVVDDGSTDRTSEAVAEFGSAVSVIRTANRGVSAARNTGARAATSELLAFLDADDVWHHRKLERQLGAMGPYTDTHVGVSGLQIIDRDGAARGNLLWPPDVDLPQDLVTFDGTPTVSCSSTAIMSRHVFERLGGFDTSFSMSADLDFLIRAAWGPGVFIVNEPLVSYRRHERNMSADVKLMEQDMLRLFTKVFADPNCPEKVMQQRRRLYGLLHRMLAGSYFQRGTLGGAMRHGLRALVWDVRVASRHGARSNTSMF